MDEIERIGELAAAAAARWGDREFVRLRDDALSFAEVDRWSTVIAEDLVRHGVGRGDRVMVFLVNRLEVVSAAVAAWKIGAIATPVVAIYRTHELSEIVRDSRPAAVLTAAALGPRRLAEEMDASLRAAGVEPKVRYLADGGEGPDGWSALPGRELAPAGDALPEMSAPQDECLRLYTSGSTSAPKGVRLHSPSVIFGGRQFHDRLGIGPTDTGLALAPVAHIAGFLAACLVPLTTGASAVILPAWDVREALRVIDERKATWSLGAAVFLKDMVEAYEARRDEGLHVLTHYVSGGANTAPDLVERADALGMWAARTYGMTEASGVVTLAPRESSVERRSRFDGKLADNAEVRILSPEDGSVLPAGSEGVISIRGVQLLLGYTDEAATRDQIDADGWFDTGDLGIVTRDGWMTITGRTKDIINRGGEKFSSADIEHVIHRHPDVSAAAVVGVPHERLGESVCAFVVVRPGAEVPTGGQLAEFMAGQDVARAKIPAEWHVVPEIPRTASGKVQKHLLRADRDGTAPTDLAPAAT